MQRKRTIFPRPEGLVTPELLDRSEVDTSFGHEEGEFVDELDHRSCSAIVAELVQIDPQGRIRRRGDESLEDIRRLVFALLEDEPSKSRRVGGR